MKRAKITQTIEALPASKLIGHDVRNHEGEYLGKLRIWSLIWKVAM